MNGITITLFLGTSFFILVTSIALDTITANQTVNDTTTIESAHGNFELGFFSPGSSKNRYVGIWYKKISKRTVVWVANRQIPLTDASGVLRINANGSLVLADGASRQIWSSNSSRTAANNNSVVVVQLLDTGNLVIKYENDVDPDNYLWQSFDHLADNFLPGMKLGWDLVTGLSRNLTSWRSDDDPSVGDFTFGINRDGYPRMLLYKNSNVQFRYGPWDGVQFNGVDFSVPESSFQVIPVSNEKELYYTYNVMNNSVVMRMFVHPNGSAQFLIWNNQSENWENSLTPQRDVCDQYATCGANASCDNRKSGRVDELCGCLEGYVPAFPEKWKSANWSDGCTLKTNFNCGGDKFVRYSGWKLPDTQHSWFNNNMNLDDCKNMCLTNCSCTAYSNVDIRQEGTGCLLWFGALIDIRDYSGAGLDFYVRIVSSELEVKKSSGTKKGLLIAVVTVLGSMLVLLGLFLLKKRMQRRKGILEFTTENEVSYENESEDLDLPLFDFFAIANATDNFSANNKLGEGGFGAVYKGVLDDGKYIAVKRLSKNSRQGANEFKTEVSLIAKLQHRNLVRLLGCCIRDGEMLLIYEYMPNKSLDSLLFDQELSKSLDWPKRYNIINGIARGLLYLHQDSRLRIIHRDLKPSNILLDNEMNPRISDFGMAKSFIGSETEANTTRVVGTLGYMSPEYALDGTFSVKSDVYSFGVLVLEIVSGKKMRHFYDSNESLNLLNYAWKLYTEDKFSELIDGAIKNSYNQCEAFRSIQIALLCVNANPDYRPSMAHVVSMMTSEAELPNPKQPEFYTRLNTTRQPATGLSTSNKLTVSLIGPR